MSGELLLVGSVPLASTEQVIRTFGDPLGQYLDAMPDGEVGERRWWVIRLSYQVFNGHPELDVMRRPKPDDGVERLVPRDRTDSWQFKVKDGIDAVRFGHAGYRLGFASDAINSYFVFKALKQEGVLPSQVRFQISVPLVNSVVNVGTFPTPGDIDKVRPGYEAALAAEIKRIVDELPQSDIAFQWDCSWEITDMYGGIKGFDAAGALERNIGQIERLSRIVPDAVMLGIHFCFGTFGGWPRFAPENLGGAVELAKASLARAGRRIDWIHIPTLDNVDEAFYAPLQQLDGANTRVFLGLIHNMDSFRARLSVARKFLPNFGLAAYCGFGREPASALPRILEDHLEAVAIAREMKAA
jgi:hypothetical protein